MNQQDLILKLNKISTSPNSSSAIKVLAEYLALSANNPRFKDVNFTIEGQQIFIHQAISYLHEVLVWRVRYKKTKGWNDIVDFPNINDIKDLSLRRQIYDDAFLILNSLQEYIVDPLKLKILERLFFAHDLLLEQRARQFVSIFWMEYREKVDAYCQKNGGRMAIAQISTSNTDKDFWVYINQLADAYLVFFWYQKIGTTEKAEIQIPVNDIEGETRIEISDNMNFYEALKLLDIACFGVLEFKTN